MLRLAVVVLLIANAAMLAFNLGLLDRLGSDRDAEAEPQRLARQVDPDRVQVLTPQAASAAIAAAAAAAAASAAAAAAPACMQAGPFAGADAAPAEKLLADLGLPASSWQAERSDRGGIYLVYMGRYADPEAVQRKLKELERIQVSAEPLRDAPEFQPGVSLGRFESQAPAAAELARLVQRGVRTARVVTLRAATPTLMLRVPAADAALRQRLATLALPGGLGFVRCEAAAPPSTSASATPAASAASGAAPTAAPASGPASQPAAARAALPAASR